MMDTQQQNTGFNQPRNKGRVWAGMFLLIIGAIFFIREADFFFFPNWLFSWPVILIAVGVYTGIKHHFRGPGWLIPVIVGGIFLIDRFDIGLDLHRFIVPIIIFGIGLVMILRPKHNGVNGGGWDNWGGARHRYRRNRGETAPDQTYPIPSSTPISGTQDTGNPYQDNGYFDITSVLGSTHRVITTKNFKGGDITCFLGGVEIDMSHADINGTVVLDITAVMGGAKLIVPTNWEVKPDITNVLGGVEDKRQVQGKVIDFNKILLLKGTTFMGGIELRSF